MSEVCGLGGKYDLNNIIRMLTNRDLLKKEKDNCLGVRLQKDCIDGDKDKRVFQGGYYSPVPKMLTYCDWPASKICKIEEKIEREDGEEETIFYDDGNIQKIVHLSYFFEKNGMIEFKELPVPWNDSGKPKQFWQFIDDLPIPKNADHSTKNQWRELFFTFQQWRRILGCGRGPIHSYEPEIW